MTITDLIMVIHNEQTTPIVIANGAQGGATLTYLIVQGVIDLIKQLENNEREDKANGKSTNSNRQERD
jgi:hypothetical protein